jgi:hypothetical protein
MKFRDRRDAARQARIAREQQEQKGRDRVAQFAVLDEINKAIEDGDYVTLTSLLEIDFALIADMTITEWQQTVIVRLHDFCRSVGIEYKWQTNNDNE